MESHIDYVIAGQAEAFRLQATASDLAGVAHVYIDSHNAARTLIVGLYSDGSGHPGSLLSTGSVSTVQLAAWNSVSLTPTPLESGKTYWLAILGESGTLRYRDRDKGPCPSETSAQTNLAALGASWRTGRLYTSCPPSAYVTVAAPVFGSPTPVEPVLVESPPPVESPPVEPPPAAPTNTVLPAIGGIATEGQVLSATNGSWNGSPTSYAYQWQDCDASANNCSNVSGATSSTHKLVSGDVGHTMRVVVTASNTGGSTQATSAGVGPVGALPPTASFTVTSASPVVGQALTFNGSSSSCPDGPCAYAWSDDGSATRPIPALWPLGSGSTLEYTFSGAGTKYMRLVVTDATGQTATVEHNVVVGEASSPPPPPTAPSNTAPPTVSGSTQLGQTLTATTGSWSGDVPMSYAYQWQDCGASGEGCANIAGATTAGHAVTEADVGHTIRVIVTATNGAGSSAQASASTSIVEGSPASCTTTVTPSTSASTIAGTIVSAHNGDTVCLAAGSYPSISVNNAAHTGYVTVEPVSGAAVTVNGMQVTNSSFLRFQGLRMTAGFNLYDTGSVASHDYQIVGNTIGNTAYGVVIDGKNAPISKVLIQGNYIHDLDFAGSSCTSPGPGYAGGQGVTIYYGDGITVSHNTFRSISWHYIQGSGEAQGTVVDHNLFEGPIPSDRLACTHLNVWQIWSGGANDTFSNNIVRGTPGSPAAVTPIMFETGPGGGTCSDSLSNTIIANNLFVYSSTAYAVQVLTTAGLTYTNNTSIGSEYGVWLDRSDTCGPGSNYNIQHNVSVENLGNTPDFSLGACTGTCTYDYNVSQDSSAGGSGSTHNVTGWIPSFLDKIGYQPISLPFAAGYQGGGGP